MNYSIINDRSFWYGELKKELLPHFLYKTVGGFVLLCTSGNASITIGIRKYEITENAELIILPGTTFSFVDSTNRFYRKSIHFFERVI